VYRQRVIPVQPMKILRIRRVHVIATPRRDVNRKVCAIHSADVRRVDKVAPQQLIEGPFRQRGPWRWRDVPRAAVILPAAAAGFALRPVNVRIIAATGSRPEVRSHAALLELPVPLRRDVNRQHIGVVRRRVRLHHPRALPRENRERRLIGIVRRIGCSQQHLVRAVHQLYLSLHVRVFRRRHRQGVQVRLRSADDGLGMRRSTQRRHEANSKSNEGTGEQLAM
jgi:hypothetical protein